MFTRILIGLIIAALCFLLVWKTEWIHVQVGSWHFAEKYLGSEGGTRLAIKLIGILGVFIGLLTVAGLQDNFVLWILRKIIPGFGS